MKKTILIYIGILFVTCLYMFYEVTTLYRFKKKEFDEELKLMRENEKSIEGFGFGDIVSFFKKITNFLKSISPRYINLVSGVTNSDLGFSDSGKILQTSATTAANWFQLNVEYFNKGPQCWLIFFINAIIQAFSKGFYTHLYSPFITALGLGASKDIVFLLFPYNFPLPTTVLQCFECNAKMTKHEIDFNMKHVIPTHHHNMRAHFQRARCNFQQAFKPL
jgi:hypothetical protein